MLHVLTRGGAVRHDRRGLKVAEVICVTRDGAILDGFALNTTAACCGGVYRISPGRRLAVRAQPDNAN